MTRKIMEDIDLAMQCSLKLDLVSYTGYNYFFLGFCKNVKIVIKGLKTRHLISVFEQRDHDLVLDQFFLNLVKFS